MSLRNIIIALSMLVTLVVAYLFITSSLSGSNEPVTLTEVENAVFKSLKPSGLVYGNLQQTQRLLGLFGDAEMDEKVNATISRAPSVGTVGASDALLNASDYFVSSVVLGNEGSLTNSLTVVQGNYADVDIKAELAQRFTMQEVEKNLVLLERKSSSKEDDFECPTDDTQEAKKPALKDYAYVSDTQIIISSSPKTIKSFLKAYSQPVEVFADEQNRLSHWRDYRHGSLFSVTVFDQKLLSQDFKTQMVSSALLGDASYQQVGLRANLNVAKQSLDISFDASLNDKGAASDLADKIEGGIADLNSENKDIFPSVIDLLSRVSVKADSGLHIGLELDKGIASEIESVATDFVSMIFSPTLSSSDDDNSEPQEEVLDKYSWDYAINSKVLNQASLPNDQFQRFLPLVNKGNIAFFIKDFGIKAPSSFDKEQGETLQLAIEVSRPAALGEARSGWNDSGIKQSLSITKVLDEEGKNLLVDERCKKNKYNRELNHQANESSSYSNGAIKNVKSVRLVDDGKTPKVSKVVGEYNFNTPINIELKDLTLSAPSQSWQGGSFELTDSKNGSVSYVLKDEESRLLNVIGLNAAGQPLSYSSSFGTGTRFTKKFKGDVATVRLALAGDFKEESFPFEINSIIPTLKPEHKTETSIFDVKPIMANERQVEAFSAAKPLANLSEEQKKAISSKLRWSGYSLETPKNKDLGNVLLSNSMLFFKHDPVSTWSNNLSGLIIMPHSEVLLSADALVVARLKVDGEPVEPAIVSISKSTRGEELVPTISSDGLELDMATFKIPFDEQPGQIKLIEGMLEFTFPTKTSVRTFKPNADNSKIEGLTFIEYAYNHQGSTKYKVDESLKNASLIKFTTIEGDEYAGKVEIDNGITTVTLDSLVELSQVDFWFVDESEVIKEELKFIPKYL